MRNRLLPSKSLQNNQPLKGNRFWPPNYLLRGGCHFSSTLQVLGVQLPVGANFQARVKKNALVWPTLKHKSKVRPRSWSCMGGAGIQGISHLGFDYSREGIFRLGSKKHDLWGKDHPHGIELRRNFSCAGREIPPKPAALDMPPSAQDTCLWPCASCWKRLRWLHIWHRNTANEGCF